MSKVVNVGVVYSAKLKDIFIPKYYVFYLKFKFKYASWIYLETLSMTVY